MQKQKMTIWALVFSLLTLAFSFAQAAESDTHFRGSYIKLRLYGISHEYALFLAKNNQGVDEMLWTSAFLFSNQRLLHHFHGDNSHMEPVDPSLKDKLKSIVKTHLSLAERNHALGNLHLHWGLKYGNAKLIGMGLHHLTDTYFHAGFAAALGHAANDHSPDDTSKDPAKYDAYINAFGEAAKAIRSHTDDWGRDYETAIRILSPVARKYKNLDRDLTVEDFQNTSFISDIISRFEDFQNLHMKDVQTDPTYKREAYRKIYTHLVQSGIVAAHVNFEDFFPEELINVRTLTVEDGVRLAIRNELYRLLNGETGYIELRDVGNKPSGMSRYLRSNFDSKKFSVEIERFENDLLSFVNQQKEATQAMYSIEGHVDSVQEEKAANKITQIEVDEARLLGFFDSPMKAKMLSAMGLLDGVSKLNGGLTPDFLKKVHDIATELKLPAGVSRHEVQQAGSLVSEHAKFLATNAKAAQLATGIVKDFVPVKFNGWVKSQFALDFDMRAAEVIYKDELYRRFINHHFGENFVNEKRGLLIDSFSLASKFKISSINTTVALSEIETRSAAGANALADAFGWKESSRDDAYKVSLNGKSRMLLPTIMAPLTLATFPIGLGQIPIQKLKAYAYEHAKGYQTMTPNQIEAKVKEREWKPVSEREVLNGLTLRGGASQKGLSCRRPSKTK